MTSLPLFLFALPAGALADLLDRRRLILFAQIGALVTALGMAGLAYFHLLNAPLLLVATFQLGVASAFTVPAWQAMIPEIVGKPQLGAAISLGGIGFNLARSLGPVIGGLLVASLGAAPVFALNAVSFGAVILAILLTQVDAEPRNSEQEQMIGAMVAAVRYTRHSPAMHAVLIRAGLYVLGAAAGIPLLPLVIRSHGWTGFDFGLLMGAYGIGAIVFAVFLLPKFRTRFGFDQVITFATFGSMVSLTGVAFARDRATLGLVLCVAGASWMTGMNTFSLAAQSAFPNWVRARSSAIYLVVAQGAFGVGAFAWGWLTQHFSLQVALVSAAAWLLVSALLSRLLPLNQIASLDLTPSNHWTGHQLMHEPAPSDGPVLVTLEYIVDPARVDEFKAAIQPLRRIRLRDGAFRWTLFNDLDRPDAYRETFLVGSWAEHLRQHARATVEDRRVEQAVRAFHQGPERLLVKHFLLVNLRDSVRERERNG